MASPVLTVSDIKQLFESRISGVDIFDGHGETFAMHEGTGVTIRLYARDLVLGSLDFLDSVVQPFVARVKGRADPNTASNVVDEITKARGSVYGPFLHNSIVAQAIKRAMRGIPDPDNEGLNWDNLPLDVREALDLIALKMSRILTGDPEYLDNWDDIGGYAKIVADRIRKSKPATAKKD